MMATELFGQHVYNKAQPQELQQGAENEEDEWNPEFNTDDLVDSNVDTSLAMEVRLSLPQILRSKIRREQPSFKYLSPVI